MHPTEPPRPALKREWQWIHVYIAEEEETYYLSFRSYMCKQALNPPVTTINIQTDFNQRGQTQIKLQFDHSLHTCILTDILQNTASDQHLHCLTFIHMFFNLCPAEEATPISNFQLIRLLNPNCWYKFTYIMANSADPDQFGFWRRSFSTKIWMRI